MSGCVAVFDVGKTNIEIVVFDRGGAILAERSAPNTPLAPTEWPYLRLDTEGAWAFLIGALKELGARLHRGHLDHDAWLRRRPHADATARRFRRSTMSSIDCITVDAGL